MQHWLDSAGLAATAYGGYKTYQQVKPLYSEKGKRGSAGGYEALGDVDDAEVSARKFSYSAPQGGGGVTSSIVINGKTVDFGHGGRHLEGTGLNVDMVNKTLANEISKIHPGTGQFYKGQVVVDGVTIEYTSYGVKDGVINVGTYYPIQK